MNCYEFQVSVTAVKVAPRGRSRGQSCRLVSQRPSKVAILLPFGNQRARRGLKYREAVQKVNGTDWLENWNLFRWAERQLQPAKLRLLTARRHTWSTSFAYVMTRVTPHTWALNKSPGHFMSALTMVISHVVLCLCVFSGCLISVIALWGRAT